MAHDVQHYNLDQKFDFTAATKKSVFTVLGIGAVLLIIGIVMAMFGGGHHEVAEAEGHAFHWYERLYANLWINNVYFTGIAIIGVFFFAIQYAAQAGWSSAIVRVMLSLGNWLPIAGVLMIVTFFIANHDLFHWTHAYLFDKSSPEYDSIIDGKGAFFYWPMEKGTFPIFYILRMVLFFGFWVFFFKKLQSLTYNEDLIGGTTSWYKIRTWSAFFLIFFAVSSSIA
ncbi:MAG: quinol:cytochrome C oxidoreductase, partial [Algoriphagus sp.]